MPFSGSDYVQSLARRLVLEFEDAGTAGTPGLVGSAREHPARKRLEMILPGTVGVGSGLVVDSYGGVSKQQDIVIYEKGICPVFSLNDTPEATFYPVEGVIAVGEVKSQMTSATIADCFDKIISVKELRRHSVDSSNQLNGIPLGAPSRTYGSSLSVQGGPNDAYDQTSNWNDRILGFGLFGTLGLSIETALQRVSEAWKSEPLSSPDILATLTNGFFQRIEPGPIFAHGPAPVAAHILPSNAGFPHLVERISWFARHGRTVPIEHFGRYLRGNPQSTPPLDVAATVFI